MNIWILNHHALTPDMGGGTRHYDFAQILNARGHNVTIIASSFHYSQYKEMKQYNKTEYLIEVQNGVNFVWIKTPHYFGNGIGRVKNMLSYMIKTLKILPTIEELQKPDIILGSAVHLFAVFSAFKLSQKYKTPFIMEVRDLWPQTLIDMGMSKWHPFILLLGWLEQFLYKRADKVISNLPYAYDYIGKFIEKEKFVWISNGVNLSQIQYVPKQKSEKFIISYTGALGVANNLQVFLEAAKRLKNQKDIYFQIVGNGAEKERLHAFVEQNNLLNVSIENSVPKNEVTNILQNSDVLFLGLKDSPLYRFGISLNKLFDYMASGRVIVFAGNSRNNPIKEANAGYSIPPDDIEALENVILEIYHLPHEQRVQIGEQIRKYVEVNYSTDILVDKLEALLINDIK